MILLFARRYSGELQYETPWLIVVYSPPPHPFFTRQDGALKCQLDFYFVRRNDEVIPGRKDVDNMVKFILDAFEGPLYENDNSIVGLLATKQFSTTNDAFVNVKVSME